VAQVQLGETLTDLKRYPEAQAVLRPAALALERVQGPDNRYTAGAWSAYAFLPTEDAVRSIRANHTAAGE
ncbi:MAG TPA: hypothetical protein VGI91_04670, partial [Steroidobacteraceae bacterium]